MLRQPLSSILYFLSPVAKTTSLPEPLCPAAIYARPTEPWAGSAAAAPHPPQMSVWQHRWRPGAPPAAVHWRPDRPPARPARRPLARAASSPATAASRRRALG